MASTERLRVGMFGTIDHINVLAAPAQERDDIDFVGIAEPDTSRGDEIAEKYGTRRFATAEELLAEGLDVAGAFTPFTHRAEDIVAYLEAGLHVLTDKPAAITSAGLSAVRAAHEARPAQLLTMALMVRVSPFSLKIKELLRSGAIGTPVSVSTRKSYTLRRRQRPPFMFDEKLSGGEWVELAVHDVDLVSWLLERDYVAVTATHGNVTSPEEPYQDHGAGLFQLEGGVTAFIEHNRLNPSTADDGLRWHLTIVGSEGVIDHGAGLTLWNDRADARTVTDLPPEPSFFGNFVDAVRGEAEQLVSAADTFRATEVVLAAYESASRGGVRVSIS